MEKVNENVPPRVWVYARCPGSYTATKNQAEFLALRARLSGATVAGISMDTKTGWNRPGYRELLHRMKQGDFNCIYITRMGSLGHSERQLLRFFSTAMKHNIKVRAIETDLRSQANAYSVGRKVERRAMRNGWEMPWA